MDTWAFRVTEVSVTTSVPDMLPESPAYARSWQMSLSGGHGFDLLTHRVL
jgi:hypothetical protein